MKERRLDDHPTIPAAACGEPTDMRGKIECALVAGMNAKDTIGEMAARVLEAMAIPTHSMMGYAKRRCHISREYACEVWHLMVQEALCAYDLRRAAGESVALYRSGSSVLVVRVPLQKADASANPDFCRDEPVEAAAEIDRLWKCIRALEAALTPFSALANEIEAFVGPNGNPCDWGVVCKWPYLVAAREALRKSSTT